MSDMNNSSGGEESIDNLWGDALSEQHSAGISEHMASSPFSDDMNLILDIPVKMTVELGRTKMTIKELLRLSQGSVVSLDGLAGEPLDILINGYLIAQGEVVVVSDKFGIRITDIITPSERMHRLSR
ncbi:flagellar motor switch protein FliN [Pantoea sp. NPDC088449]|uniref:Flagellar motor switch protein FliN n=1 Tax=Candidatus Pantoea floridensis TaxID=1938870 RepID=A0A286BXU1_9GAMM|nr:flagellar motor switch protein FliN [Pantoea floridensis]PIF21440.1 flagellar motor switch protein FliN/FliY [Enterobacteriaceae bacterium JKS000233]SOD38952.1 flagellar motor switch protein FliN/FliY [Pantoea floridensis]HBZ14797.1 flagellar motor switch protein FliN [Pantoea sp.]